MPKPLHVAIFYLFAHAVGCGSDDPAAIIRGPGAGAASSTTRDASVGAEGGEHTPGPDGASASSDAGVIVGAIVDASIDSDPGYRDPRQSDGACGAPNKVCTTGDAASICIAVGTDVDNCGACGNACVGPSRACLASQCSCTDVGFDYCAGKGCMDVSADFNNCGACGKACDPNSDTDCASGKCVNNN